MTGCAVELAAVTAPMTGGAVELDCPVPTRIAGRKEAGGKVLHVCSCCIVFLICTGPGCGLAATTGGLVTVLAYLQLPG